MPIGRAGILVKPQGAPSQNRPTRQSTRRLKRTVRIITRTRVTRCVNPILYGRT